MTLVKQWETRWTISSNKMPGNTWFKWAFVIRPSPDSSSFLKTVSSFSTYFASKSTKTRIKRLHWAHVVQGQAGESIWKHSSILSLNPFPLQDHYSTTEYSEPIRLLRSLHSSKFAGRWRVLFCSFPFCCYIFLHVPSSANVQWPDARHHFELHQGCPVSLVLHKSVLHIQAHSGLNNLKTLSTNINSQSL